MELKSIARLIARTTTTQNLNHRRSLEIRNRFEVQRLHKNEKEYLIYRRKRILRLFND